MLHIIKSVSKCDALVLSLLLTAVRKFNPCDTCVYKHMLTICLNGAS